MGLPVKKLVLRLLLLGEPSRFGNHEQKFLTKMHDSTSESTKTKSYALKFEHPLTLTSRLGLTPGGIFCCAGGAGGVQWSIIR